MCNLPLGNKMQWWQEGEEGVTETTGWALTPQRVFKIHQQARGRGLLPPQSVSAGAKTSKGVSSVLYRE